ncbi:MAG TPA: hypothetical protein VNG32_03115 [Candidatus Dormibacteraeota bacterium]|nr:hypothetical protein [Candidatus Dormibacteraeota bacterium]
MSERSRQTDGPLTGVQVVRALQKIALANHYLNTVMWLEEYDSRTALTEHIGALATKPGGYKLPDEAWDSLELTRIGRQYIRALTRATYAKQEVPVYKERITAHLDAKLRPDSGPQPIIHATRQTNGFTMCPIYNSPEQRQARYDAYVRVNEVSGPCVSICLDNLSVRSPAEDDLAFIIDPILEDGTIRQDTQIAVEYPA